MGLQWVALDSQWTNSAQKAPRISGFEVNLGLHVVRTLFFVKSKL